FSTLGTASARRGISVPWLSKLIIPVLTRSATASRPGTAAPGPARIDSSPWIAVTIRLRTTGLAGSAAGPAGRSGGPQPATRRTNKSKRVAARIVSLQEGPAQVYAGLDSLDVLTVAGMNGISHNLRTT